MLDGTISFTHPQELLHGLKEIFIEEIYKLSLPRNPYIIDCGANIGLSVLYLKKQYADARIVAFEPDRNNFELLANNVRSYKLENVELKNEAVWIENTAISFSNEGTMSSKVDLAAGGENKVQAARLKDYLNEKVDFLKIDIEGAEYVVLKDIAENLGNVSNMFFEYHGQFSQNHELVEIFQIIERAGFHFYIKEAAPVYNRPFVDVHSASKPSYDIQLNIFCFRKN